MSKSKHLTNEEKRAISISHLPPAIHGHHRNGRGTRTWTTWTNMLSRCSNPNDIGYRNYGGRGIKVCDRWNEFKNFLSDMGERPEGKTIDRIDNNGNYDPQNFRWSTVKEQCLNRRPPGGKVLNEAQVIEMRSRYRFRGYPDTKTLAREYGVSKTTAHLILKGKVWRHLICATT